LEWEEFSMFSQCLSLIAYTLLVFHPYRVIPAGTEVTIKLAEPIDAGDRAAGDTFSGVLVKPIVSDGTELVPAGAAARVRVIQVPQFAARERGEVALTLASLTVGGKQYPTTSGFAQAPAGESGIARSDLPNSAVQSDVAAAISAGEEGGVVATVHGAGVSLQVIRGQRIKVAQNAVVKFTLAELVALRGEGSN
jgi:hypothetical protein